MFGKLLQSLHESVKKRNTPDAYVVDTPQTKDVIHRGYIQAAIPVKYDFVPREKAKSKNDGTHVYRFSNKGSIGLIEIDHRLNANPSSGHETTSSFSSEVKDFEPDINLMRTILPAVQHHVRSHDPDILKFAKGFKFTKELISRLDPENKIFDVTKTDSGTILKKKAPIDEKSKRIISHIKNKVSINKNKEK
jgi:hypothetical protein